MNSQETTVLLILFFFASAENACAARNSSKKWINLLILLLPVFFWIHAVSWFYTIPLQQIASTLQAPSTLQIFSFLLFLSLVLELIVPWILTRTSQGFMFWGAQITASLPSLATILLVYPLSFITYQKSFFSAGTLSLQISGSVMILILSLLHSIWLSRLRKPENLWILRPVLIGLQWFILHFFSF